MISADKIRGNRRASKYLEKNNRLFFPWISSFSSAFFSSTRPTHISKAIHHSLSLHPTTTLLPPSSFSKVLLRPRPCTLLHPHPNAHSHLPSSLISKAALHTRSEQLPKAERRNSYNSWVPGPFLTRSRKELFWKQSNAAFGLHAALWDMFSVVLVLRCFQKQAPAKCQDQHKVPH